jgi:hypothetical protein
MTNELDYFKQTERRLYAYPIIKKRLSEDIEKLAEYQSVGLPEHSRGIVKYIRSGRRLDPEDIKDALIFDLKAAIISNEDEIREIDTALEIIAGDEYAKLIALKYFEHKTDEHISEVMSCADRTIRTHKKLLIRQMALYLYGAATL